MTAEQEKSLRQRAIEHVAEVRRKLNPQTTEHIAHAAREASPPELRAYAEFIGWKHLKMLQEDNVRAEYRPGRAPRSGHKNASGRFRRAVASILDMRYSVGEESKQLGDMTIPELAGVVEAYGKRAAEMEAERDRLSAVLAAAEAKGVKRIKQLGAKRVEELYVGEELANV